MTEQTHDCYQEIHETIFYKNVYLLVGSIIRLDSNAWRTDCDDLIIIDRQYFLDNEDFIRDWALYKKNPRLISKTLG